MRFFSTSWAALLRLILAYAAATAVSSAKTKKEDDQGPIIDRFGGGGGGGDLSVDQATEMSMVDLITSVPSLSILTAAVIAADLVEALSGTGPYTVMAPWNAAFADLPAEFVEKLLQPEWILHLRDILLYHVYLNGEIPLDSIATSPPRTINMANGQDAQIVLQNRRIQVNDIVAIAYAEPSNGIAYMLDAVLLPAFVSRSLLDVAATTPDTSTLASLVVAAGLEEALSNPDASLTVFAPTNAAFAALDPTLLAFWQTPEGAETLETVLLYHVVPGVYPSVNIMEGGENLLASLAPPNGQVLSVVRDGSTVSVNDGIVVAIPDVLANNGIIHVIPQVLIPPVLPSTPTAPTTAALPPVPAFPTVPAAPVPSPTGMAPRGLLPTTMPVVVPAPPVGTLVDIAMNIASLGTLVGAAVAADLQDTLSADGMYTVFAPDNEAFAAVPVMSDYLNDVGWILHLQETLLFHVVAGQVLLSSDLTDGMTITMANDADVTVDINPTSGAVALTPATNLGQSLVETANVMATNGVAHIVSKVLLPSYFATTILDVARVATPTLASLVVAADLQSFLDETVGLTVRCESNYNNKYWPAFLMHEFFGVKLTNTSRLPLFAAFSIENKTNTNRMTGFCTIGRCLCSSTS
jgi:transforming growth factor-beta-induced protein